MIDLKEKEKAIAWEEGLTAGLRMAQEILYGIETPPKNPYSEVVGE